MSNSNQRPRFKWQNKVLRDDVYPFRLKKLREFLLFYWEAETLAQMKKASVEERKKMLSEVAVEITAQRQEWQDQFEVAFVDLTANDKWFAMKTTEKYQLWYLQDQIKNRFEQIIVAHLAQVFLFNGQFGQGNVFRTGVRIQVDSRG
jgi:hypothetical protein